MGIGHWAWGIGHWALGTDLLNNSPHTSRFPIPFPRSPFSIYTITLTKGLELFTDERSHVFW
ncbi:hypothetical protein B4U84_23030 [Westiellopsis prolifica IICB1]|nr:hypothetical protein B4U84_23030 [Westiellopsis prolifica IICB1]